MKNREVAVLHTCFITVANLSNSLGGTTGEQTTYASNLAVRSEPPLKPGSSKSLWGLGLIFDEAAALNLRNRMARLNHRPDLVSETWADAR